MKDFSKQHRIGLVLEIVLFFIALFIYFVNKDYGKVALVIWGLFLVGIPFCFSCCMDKDEAKKRDVQSQNIAK